MRSSCNLLYCLMVRLSVLNIKINEFSKHPIRQVPFINIKKQITVRFVSYETVTF
jgi:hypothetical protein